MRFTAIYASNGRQFHETFSCSSMTWAMWYAKGRAERFGVELVAVVEANSKEMPPARRQPQPMAKTKTFNLNLTLGGRCVK